MSRETQRIFVYGTLQSGHREQARYVTKLLAATPATVPGRLFQLEEGYPIAQIALASVLVEASNDPFADWDRVRRSERPPCISTEPFPQIHGEILEIPLSKDALGAMDAWEGFDPRRQTVYRRVAVSAVDSSGKILPSWIYACLDTPKGATLLPAGRWHRPSGL